MRPTWRILQGVCTESLALETALACGVRPGIVQRAAEVLRRFKSYREMGMGAGVLDGHTPGGAGAVAAAAGPAQRGTDAGATGSLVASAASAPRLGVAPGAISWPPRTAQTASGRPAGQERTHQGQTARLPQLHLLQQQQQQQEQEQQQQQLAEEEEGEGEGEGEQQQRWLRQQQPQPPSCAPVSPTRRRRPTIQQLVRQQQQWCKQSRAT